MFTWGVAHGAWLGRPEVEGMSQAFPFPVQYPAEGTTGDASNI